MKIRYVFISPYIDPNEILHDLQLSIELGLPSRRTLIAFCKANITLFCWIQSEISKVYTIPTGYKIRLRDLFLGHPIDVGWGEIIIFQVSLKLIPDHTKSSRVRDATRVARILQGEQAIGIQVAKDRRQGLPAKTPKVLEFWTMASIA